MTAGGLRDNAHAGGGSREAHGDLHLADFVHAGLHAVVFQQGEHLVGERRALALRVDDHDGRHVSLPGRHIVNIESENAFNAALADFLRT